MSLTDAIQIGRSALSAAQIGIQVSGNNMANAATPGYTRQVARFIPARGDSSLRGASIGSGVLVQGVQRQVDSALQGRLWSGGSDLAAASTRSSIFSQIEARLGELGDEDDDHSLSSQLTAFFGSWSERANQSPSATAVVQQGDRLASFMRGLRSDLVDQSRQIEDQIGATVQRANQLLQQIAQLNQSIGASEVGNATANSLRDQRDAAISELSGIMDVTVVDRGSSGVDVLVGSNPVVLGTQVTGLHMNRETVNGETTVSVETSFNNQKLEINSGSLGALLGSRITAVQGTIDKLDNLAAQLIFEVNRLHSTGTNARGLRSATGTLAMGGNTGLALNDARNDATNRLPFHACNGSFVINVRNEASGGIQTTRINVDLDGVTAAGTPGTGDDTSAQDIADSINAIAGLHASFTPEGKLQITADSGVDFSFADDSSGAVALLGLNSYFSGKNAGDIGVRSDLLTDPSQLTAGKIVNGTLVENGTALDIAGLQTKQLGALGGRSLTGLWADAVAEVGGNAAGAASAANAAAVVYDSLDAQRAALSGVSIDEESINLMDFQRQYQAAAKVISTADDLTQVLLGLL